MIDFNNEEQMDTDFLLQITVSFLLKAVFKADSKGTVSKKQFKIEDSGMYIMLGICPYELSFPLLL